MIHVKPKICHIYVIAFLVGMANVLLSSSTLMYGVIFLEIGVLIYKLCKRDYVGYFCYYLIFICLSIEFDVFLESDSLYSLKNIRFLGLNLGNWLMLPYAFSALLYYKPLYSGVKQYSAFAVLGRNLIRINLIAAMVGLIALLLNENNIWGMENFLSAYIENAYSFFLQPFLMFWGIALAIKHNQHEIHNIGITLHAILVASIFMMLTSLVSGVSGQYGSVTTAASSLISSFVCFLLLYPFLDGTKHKLINLIIALIGTFLLLTHQQSGKLFIILLIVGIVFIIQQMKGKSLIRKILSMAFFVAALILVFVVISYMSSQNNDLFNSKLYQAKEVLSLDKWNMEYFQNMDNSPRVRFGEFIDLFLEYMKKPWFIITGKGYGGTIRDWSGILYLTPEFERAAGFSLKEYANGTFFNVHEIVTPLLAFGLLGVIFYFKCLKVTWKYLTNNIWLLIAMYWFPFFYGYSFTLGAYGVACLYYGLILCSEQEHMNLII